MLTPHDFAVAAHLLGCEVAAIRAVCEVEAPKGGFLPSGEPTILFERHIFSRLTNGRYDMKYPGISSRITGGYLGGQREHSRLAEAATLDRDAALKSASWGQFQIMGMNHVAAGYARLQDFINAMYRDDAGQLEAFIGFIKNDAALLKALRKKDWATFARIYNGRDYAKNKYDVRLAQAYAKHAN